MAQVENNFKGALLTISKNVKENMFIMKVQIENLSREKETIKTLDLKKYVK